MLMTKITSSHSAWYSLDIRFSELTTVFAYVFDQVTFLDVQKQKKTEGKQSNFWNSININN